MCLFFSGSDSFVSCAFFQEILFDDFRGAGDFGPLAGPPLLHTTFHSAAVQWLLMPIELLNFLLLTASFFFVEEFLGHISGAFYSPNRPSRICS